MKIELNGKIAVVTGGSGALGETMALGLAQAGATVVILARREAQIAETVSLIQAAGGKATGVTGDVLDKAALQMASTRIMEQYGRIDILVNGAGGNQPQATTLPKERQFFDLPEEALRWVFDLNLLGTILSSQVFGQMMASQGDGVVVNVSSMASYTPLTRVVAYAAAKAAINNFTQWLAVYMAREHNPNIRVNAIAPGFFLGEQNRYLLMDEKTGALTPRGQQIIDHTPMGRFGEPEDLVGTLLWLVSDAARFVTGIVVPVDGGFSAYSGV